MVKVIMGKKGSGKTKQIIDLVNVAVNEEKVAEEARNCCRTYLKKA